MRFEDTKILEFNQYQKSDKVPFTIYVDLECIAQQESYENAKICHICEQKFENKYLKDKHISKLEIIVIIQGNIEVLHIAAVI